MRIYGPKEQRFGQDPEFKDWVDVKPSHSQWYLEQRRELDRLRRKKERAFLLGFLIVIIIFMFAWLIQLWFG